MSSSTCLKGVIVSVSSGLCEEPQQLTSTDDEQSFAQLKKVALEVGCKISPSVHRRLAFLLVSKSATEKETQKVKKAQKFGVPICTTDYIKACKQAGKRVNIEEYQLFPTPVKTKKSDESKAEITTPSKKIDKSKKKRQIDQEKSSPEGQKRVKMDNPEKKTESTDVQNTIKKKKKKSSKKEKKPLDGDMVVQKSEGKKEKKVKTPSKENKEQKKKKKSPKSEKLQVKIEKTPKVAKEETKKRSKTEEKPVKTDDDGMNIKKTHELKEKHKA